MRLTDYVFATEKLKKQYFDTVTMQVGLRYFGGKSIIGKYLLNRIFEMQAYRYEKNISATTFVDCFTGGGKMALSIPTGWFETIVMNDMDYGVYSYYVCCKESPRALIEMIEVLGKVMCEEVYVICARERNKRGKGLTDAEMALFHLDKIQCVDHKEHEKYEKGDMLLSAAMTYWVTQSSWLGETEHNAANYALNKGDKNEKLEIENRVALAKKRITQINTKMTRQHYVIENLDYVDLIQKYLYDSDTGEKKEDAIFYLDPPYHAATLNRSNQLKKTKNGNDVSPASDKEKPAPYEVSFSYEQTNAMTYLLATMKWFIKSDYDPSFFFRDPYEEETALNKGRLPADYFHDFDLIENRDQGFCRECLGSFHKGTSSGDDVGLEVIWSRYDGSKESLDWMTDDKDKQLAEDFWKNKKELRERYLYVKRELYKCKMIVALLQTSDKEYEEFKKKKIEDALNSYKNKNNT